MADGERQQENFRDGRQPKFSCCVNGGRALARGGSPSAARGNVVYRLVEGAAGGEIVVMVIPLRPGRPGTCYSRSRRRAGVQARGALSTHESKRKNDHVGQIS